MLKGMWMYVKKVLVYMLKRDVYVWAKGCVCMFKGVYVCKRDVYLCSKGCMYAKGDVHVCKRELH